MNRVLLAVLIGIVVISLLCVGLVAAVAFSPIGARIANTFDRIVSRIDSPFERRFGDRFTPEPFEEDFFEVRPLDEEEGILVRGVLPGSPADEAGLRRGDILLEANSQPVNNMRDLFAAVSESQAGDEIALLVQRGDEQLTLNATLDESPDRQPGRGMNQITLLGIVPADGFGFGNIPDFNIPNMPWMPDGDRFPMNPPFDSVPRLPEGYDTAAMVLEVTSGSPAEEAGLEPGTWILEVNGEPLENQSDLADAIGALEPGDQVTLTVAGPVSEADKAIAPEAREVEVALGENPDKAGIAYLGIRYSMIRVQFEQEETP